MYKKLKELNRDLAFAVLLSLIMMVGTLAATFSVDEIITQNAFNQMEDVTKQVANDIRIKMESEEQQARLVADMLSDHTTLSPENTQRYLRSVQKDFGMFSYAVLLPDNTLVNENNIVRAEGMALNFDTEVTKAPYFYDKIIGTDKEPYMGFIMPIQSNGEVRGLLCAYANLKKLPDSFKMYAYDGQAEFYLASGDTGNFLMDTWHGELANMFDERFLHRETKRGRTFPEMKQDVVEGKAGYTVFTSKTVGEDFYSSYAPVGVHNLSFQITVPEKIVFADVFLIRNIVTLLGIVQTFAFLCYLVYMVVKYRREKELFQQQMQDSRIVYRIQQKLFDSYNNAYMVMEALELTHSLLKAEMVYFIGLNDRSFTEFYCYPESPRDVVAKQLDDIKNNIPEVFVPMKSGNAVVWDAAQIEQYRKRGCLDKLVRTKIRNMIFEPLLNSEGKMTGVMLAVNAENEQYASKNMELLATTFLMAVRNLNAYQLVQQMGTEDALTDLKNRNAYQRTLSHYETAQNNQLCCIYMDANGLHDLNNTLGHEAGDAMLRTIATLLKEFFGSEDTYRIGGDEFVAFTHDLSEDEVKSRLAKMDALLSEKSYHVSAGYAFREGKPMLQQMIKAAEQAMYEAKRRYYAENKAAGKNRQMNNKLENILSEKRDKDRFLSIISEDFMGVYIINLANDDTREIWKPKYFAEMLEEQQYRFRPAMMMYIDRFVAKAGQDSIRKLFDYNKIKEQLQVRTVIESTYLKNDGDIVRIRVYKAEDYTEEKPNTVWIFEQFNH